MKTLTQIEEELKKEIEELGEDRFNWKVCYVNQDGVVYNKEDEIVGEIDIDRVKELKSNLKLLEEIKGIIVDIFKRYENPSYDCFKEASILDYTINKIKQELLGENKSGGNE